MVAEGSRGWQAAIVAFGSARGRTRLPAAEGLREWDCTGIPRPQAGIERRSRAMNKAFVREQESTAEFCPRCGTKGEAGGDAYAENYAPGRSRCCRPKLCSPLSTRLWFVRRSHLKPEEPLFFSGFLHGPVDRGIHTWRHRPRQCFSRVFLAARKWQEGICVIRPCRPTSRRFLQRFTAARTRN